MPINIHGKQYVLVNERLEQFLSDYPRATIDTVLSQTGQMVDTATGDMCNNYIVHAKIVPNPLQEPEIYYTGYAEERDNNGFINKTSALENAETSAVGRALAFAGYGSADSIASGEEVLRAQQVRKNFEPTTTSLDKLDRAMNECYKAKLIDDKAKLQYRKKREAGMTKKQVEAGQRYFDELLGNVNPIKKEEDGKNTKNK